MLNNCVFKKCIVHSVSSKIAYSLDARLYAKCGKLDRPRGAHIRLCAHTYREMGVGGLGVKNGSGLSSAMGCVL